LLRIEAFGELKVLRDNRRVADRLIEPPLVRAVATLLAFHGTAGVARDRVHSLLQSPASSGAAADEWWRSLTQTVGQVLGEPCLILERHHVALRPSIATSDVTDFSAALASGDLERAVQLHHGRLLEGMRHRETPAFDRWLQLQRETLASEAASALERLAVEANRRGEPLTAVRWWRQLAMQYPLNDRVSASLMEALVAAGDREGALRHARFVEALSQERLELPGDAQVLALARSLRGHDAASIDTTALWVATGTPSLSQRNGDPGDDPLARFAEAVSTRYRIEGELGRGGHGRVLRACDLRHHRPVAIKVLHPEVSPPSSATRFAREIRVVAALQHPNILPLFDSGEAAGALYFVMPLVRGASLRERLRCEQTIAVADAIRIVRQVASALGEAHRRGVVHRDIKPENILLVGSEALVADFGIACVTDGATGSGLTAPGVIVGTPHYMSPEQASPDEPVDGRSDLYALGCVLFEMLSGNVPYRGASTRAVLAQHVSAPPPNLPVRRADLPPALNDVLRRLLAKHRDQRYASAEELGEALEGILSSGGAARVAPTASRWRSASVRALAFLLASLLALAAVAIVIPTLQREATAATDARDPAPRHAPTTKEGHR